MTSLWQSLYTREEYVLLYRSEGTDEWHLWSIPNKSEALARQRLKDVSEAWPHLELRVAVKRSSMDFLDE